MAHGTGAAATAAMPTRVDNFMLVDQNLEAHELYRLADAPAVVLVTQQNGDAVMQHQAAQLNKIADVSFGVTSEAMGETKTSPMPFRPVLDWAMRLGTSVYIPLKVRSPRPCGGCEILP